MALDRSPEEVGETQSSGPNPSSDAEPVAKENAATSSDQVSAEPSQASLEAPTVAQLPVLFDEHESYRGTMHKFSVYETTARFYIVGGDLTDNRFRVLKIDRTTDYGDLSLAEDGVIYTKREVNRLIATIDEGNKSAGGLKLRCSTWGILGFIRFTGAYYMLLITKRSQVAVIGGHFIYKIDGTELIPVAASSSRFKSDRYAEEARFLGIFNNLDLSRSFYFCYSYDLTRTLQFNLLRAREAVLTGSLNISSKELNVMFVWNHHLLKPAMAGVENAHNWCIPIIHGYVDQAILSVYGRSVYLTVIARRSRFFAGARFLKRGANDRGYVANDVETEQIVSVVSTTSFHAPGPKLYANWNYTSFVQHRGSIPLFWTQDNTGVTPKPSIELNLIDPFYEAAALHFDNLFERYGAPVYVLNLVKRKDESDGGGEISRDQDVIAILEYIAEEVVKTNGFFRNGDGFAAHPTVQNGVARTNCIDCLDRTNAAQFVIGKRALGHQLHALGIISGTDLEYDTDAVNLLTHMYHDHGDTLAIQYGGSHLVNTMETYRKINQWSSHSRDMVESFKRYYHNSFLDSQRQEAYNLFLGNYIFAQDQPMLWDLSTDYYLHHSNPRSWLKRQRRSYFEWFTPAHLQEKHMPAAAIAAGPSATNATALSDDYWVEYYRPLAISSLQKLFSFRMNSTSKLVATKQAQDDHLDPSPFSVRVTGDLAAPRKRRVKKTVVPLEHGGDEISDDASSILSRSTQAHAEKRTPGHFQPTTLLPMDETNEQADEVGRRRTETSDFPSAIDSSTLLLADNRAVFPAAAAAHRTLDDIVQRSLNPTVTQPEADEYERYLQHPRHLPLVSAIAPPSPPAHLVDFLHYLHVGEPGPTTADEDVAEFVDFLTVPDDPLLVTEADAPKKRYKAYRQWLKGRSLFKQQQQQQRVD